MNRAEVRLVAGVACAVGGLLATLLLLRQGVAAPAPERAERLLAAAAGGLVVVVGLSLWGKAARVLRAPLVGLGATLGVLVILPLLALGLPAAVDVAVSALDP